MALRNTKGTVVSPDVYKREVLAEISKNLDRIVPSPGADKAAAQTPTKSPAQTSASSGRVEQIQFLSSALDALRPDELAARMFAAVPVIEISNRLAELIGDCYDSAGVQVVLGGSLKDAISKQAVSTRRRRHTILAMQTADGRWVYPTFQFRERRVRDDITALLAVFGDSPRWSVAAWFQTQAVDLGGKTPLEWLASGASLDTLQRMAGHAAGRWAA